MAKNMLAKQLWDKALERLKTVFSAEVFRMWISRLQAQNYENNMLTLGVWDDFSLLWTKANYISIIEDCLMEMLGEHITIQLVVAVPENTAEDQAIDGDELLFPENEETTAAAQVQTPKIEPKQSPRPVPPVTYIPRVANAQPRDAAVRIGLNPKYTFENFVVGKNCEFAHTLAMAVAHNPGSTYNPLFIYGGVGLGKTHLLHAIGQRAISLIPGIRVVYVTLERFMNEYIEAIRDKRCEKFRKKYRNIDILLIDDIQFLTDKEGLQEEFFHTFNTLYENKKQIVLTADRPVNEIQALQDRLVSRFNWNMVVDLQPPQVEVRMAILRQKSEILGVQIPQDVCEFIANKIRSNVRELEGALTRLSCYNRIQGKSLNIDIAKDILKDLLAKQTTLIPTIDAIQKEVARYFDIRVADILGKRRQENIAFPRQIAMYLCRQLTKQSLSVIGGEFGGRDHGTVHHACKVVKDRIEIDESVKETVSNLENTFND